MVKKAIIFGAGGQDGHYLNRLLGQKGYRVLGTGAGGQAGESAGEYQKCDITSREQVEKVVSGFLPDEAYNLAAVSSPKIAEEAPALAHAVNVDGVENLIGAIERHCPKCRIFHASSGYIFAPSADAKNEKSPFGASGEYAKTKLQAHFLVAQARKRGMFAANGILFNHESPLRGEEFVTRKVTHAAAQFKLGMRKERLLMGDLDSVRDWGFAGDYVEAMWMMLQAKKPADYVIATGEAHSVREFCEVAFSRLGMDYGKFVGTYPALLRPKGINRLVGDITLIKKELGWMPKTSFAQLVEMMVGADIASLQKEGRK